MAARAAFGSRLAKELGASNVRVNALCPGMISTAFHDTFTKDTVRTNVASATALEREGGGRYRGIPGFFRIELPDGC